MEARPFPLSNSTPATYCFLSPTEEQSLIRQELDQTIFITALEDHLLPPKHELQMYLHGRCGGDAQDWELDVARKGYLLKVPQWLHPQDLIMDYEFWVRRYYLLLLPWQTLNRADLLPPKQNIIITISDFPVNYWHPRFFRQVTAAMGILREVAHQNLTGKNKALLRLGLECYDLSLIPPSIFVGHDGQWTECRVEIEGRHTARNGGDSPPPPPSSPPEGDHGANQPEGALQEPPGPYLPPWRRLSPPDPNRRTAPAECHEDPTAVYRTRKGKPGLGNQKGITACSGYGIFPDDIRGVPQYGSARTLRGRKNKMEEFWRERTEGGDSNAANSQNLYPQNLLENTWRQGKGYDGYLTPDKSTKVWAALQAHNYGPRRGMKKTGIQGFFKDDRACYRQTCDALGNTEVRQAPESRKRSTSAWSILGPYAHLPSLSPQTVSSLANTKKHLPSLHQSEEMANFTDEDEALIQKFIGLQTEEEGGPVATIPLNATTSTSWENCLLVKVISDRTVFQAQFTVAMLAAWDADPNMMVRPVARNCFLIEFGNKRDVQTASIGGPWTFRGDLVATRQVASYSDLKPETVRFAGVLVQFFNVPANCLTGEGLEIMGKEVGLPVSPPIENFINGRRFVKMKIIIDVNEPLRDRVTVRHPLIGDFTALCSYEKISRACVFCGGLGHEMQNCVDHQRLTMLAQNPNGGERIKSSGILNPKKGLWMISSSFLPKETNPTATQPNKRREGFVSYNRSGNEEPEGNAVETGDEEGALVLKKRPRPAGPNPPDCFL